MKKLILLFLFLLVSSRGALAQDLGGLPPLKYPILLVHGATSGGSKLRVGHLNFGEYFQGIPAFLGSTNTKIYTIDLPADASIEECATIIKVYLSLNMPDQKVNIIGHSLGGLDARYLVSVLKSPQVASITTIASPHHGTPLADWCLSQAKRGTLWYRLFILFGYDLRLRRFLPEITTQFMEGKFNKLVPNRPDIPYYSVVATGKMGTRTMSPLLYFPYWWLRSIGSPMSREPNDGFVPASSQAWGTVIEEAHLDHLAEIAHDSFRFFSLKEESLAMYEHIYRRLQKDGL